MIATGAIAAVAVTFANDTCRAFSARAWTALWERRSGRALHASPTLIGMQTCTAKWAGGSCTREADAALGLCTAHDMQQRRGKPFAMLKDAHGADPRDLVAISIHIPRVDADTLAKEAKRRNLDKAEIYREALAAWAAHLRTRPGG